MLICGSSSAADTLSYRIIGARWRQQADRDIAGKCG